MRDIILTIAAGTDLVINLKRSTGYAMTTSAYLPLLQWVWTLARKVGIGIGVGNVFSSDLYYDPDEDLVPALKKFGVLGVDMEVAGLYALAHQFNIGALAILTVSNHCLTGEGATAEERQLTFSNMIELTLSTVITAQFRLLIEPIRNDIM